MATKIKSSKAAKRMAKAVCLTMAMASIDNINATALEMDLAREAALADMKGHTAKIVPMDPFRGLIA